MKIEIGATYLVKVPDSYHFESDGGGLAPDDYKRYWAGKEVIVETHQWEDGLEPGYYVRGHHKAGGNDWRADGRRFGIPAKWLVKRIRHCPQVEEYIRAQRKRIRRYLKERGRK